MGGYFYRGRHRKPTQTGRKAATIAVTGAVGFGLVQGTSYAQDWGPIIQCESGGNPRAKNPSSTASGLFQFINGTWRAYGGGEFAPTAKQATVEQQHIVANRAFAAEGYRPWNASKSCWGGKVGSSAPSPRESPRTAAPEREEPQRSPAPQRAPVRPRPTAPAPEVVRHAPTESTRTHIVRPGDTLSHIAVAHGVHGGWPALYERNRDVVGGNPDLIFPGQRLAL